MSERFSPKSRVPDDFAWPNGARLAVSVVVTVSGQRYGRTAGLWRLLRLLAAQDVAATLVLYGEHLVFDAPHLTDWVAEAGHEPALGVHMPDRLAGDELAFARALGRDDFGIWADDIQLHALRDDPAVLRRVWLGGSRDDDLPQWVKVAGSWMPLLPHSAIPPGRQLSMWQTGHLQGIMNSLQTFRREAVTQPRSLTIVLDADDDGRASVFPDVERTLEAVLATPDIWVGTLGQVAAHWCAHVPPPGPRAV